MSSGLERKPPTPLPNLEGLEREDRVEVMRDWFLGNFEDPGEHTPHDSGEGGYQYIWGGPYDALEEIGSAFPDAEQDEIEEAVEGVQADGTFEWAPADGRIQPDDLDDPDDNMPPPEPLSDRLDALAGQLDRIEGHVAALRALKTGGDLTPGIGHNHPPKELDGKLDLAAIQESIDDVRGELAKPAREEDADVAKLERAEARFGRFMAWIKEQVANVPKNLATGAVSAAGGLMFNYVVEHQDKIMMTLQPAIATISTWASALHNLF